MSARPEGVCLLVPAGGELKGCNSEVFTIGSERARGLEVTESGGLTLPKLWVTVQMIPLLISKNFKGP